MSVNTCYTVESVLLTWLDANMSLRSHFLWIPHCQGCCHVCIGDMRVRLFPTESQVTRLDSNSWLLP